MSGRFLDLMNNSGRVHESFEENIDILMMVVVSSDATDVCCCVAIAVEKIHSLEDEMLDDLSELDKMAQNQMRNHTSKVHLLLLLMHYFVLWY